MPNMGKAVHTLLLEERKRVKNVYYLSLTLMLFALGWAISAPFYTINMQSIIQDALLLGIFFSMWGLIRFFTDTFFGAFFDFIDNKKIILISLVGYALVGIAYYFVNNIIPLFILRIFHILIGSLFWVGVWAYTHKISPKNRREENIMFETIFLNAPYLIAPFIGALLFAITSPKIVFLAIPITILPAIIIFSIKGKPTKQKKKITIKKILKKEIRIIRENKKKVLTLFYVMTPQFLVSSAFFIFLPIYLLNQGYGAYFIALTATITVIPSLLTLPLGKFADKNGRIPVFTAGTIALTMGLLLFYYATTSLLLLISIFIIGSGFAIISPTANAIVGDLSGKNEKGTLSGITETAKDLGMMIGPIIGGIVLNISTLQLLSLLLSIIPVSTMLLALIFGKIPKKA
ncbi:MAG: MFS transporter [Nanoarchaeota archaeon]|nr:MFS transporter [Nanoarchaeota archaeon]